MGNFSLYGILLTVACGLAMFAFILSQIHVTNPYDMSQTTILGIIIGWIIP